jgi:N-acetylneuraminate synthase
MIIAEMGHNWPDIETACEMIESAAWHEVPVVKFQLYDIDKIKKPGDTNYEELKAKQLTKYDLETLYTTAILSNVEFLVSIFDAERFHWIREIGIELKRHKIASRVINDREVIDLMDQSGLPIIASLGAWDGEELPKHLPKRTNFLACQSRRSILRTGLEPLPKTYEEEGIAGLSDHSIGIYRCRQALYRGAKIIEKHFTFDQNWPGWDQPASAFPKEFKELVEFERSMSGRSIKQRTESCDNKG